MSGFVARFGKCSARSKGSRPFCEYQLVHWMGIPDAVETKCAWDVCMMCAWDVCMGCVHDVYDVCMGCVHGVCMGSVHDVCMTCGAHDMW